MKRFLLGLLLGISLAIGATAYADDVQSILGKKVDGSFPLEIGGKKAEKDAIVIEGTSYVPVRAAGELFGYDVSFIDSKVKLQPIKGVVDVEALEKVRQERQKAYEQLKMDQGKQKTPEELLHDELQAKIKQELEAEEARKKKSLEEEKTLKTLEDVNAAANASEKSK